MIAPSCLIQSVCLVHAALKVPLYPIPNDIYCTYGYRMWTLPTVRIQSLTESCI